MEVEVERVRGCTDVGVAVKGQDEGGNNYTCT